MSNENRYKVTIRSKVNSSDFVRFDVSPTFSESRNTNYKSADLIHAPGSIVSYVNTSTRTFQISGKLISRTRDEATETLNRINLLKSWSMPYFGKNTTNHDTQLSMLGSPPDVLMLTAYSKEVSNNNFATNINNVPTVMSQLIIDYPNDIDYIPTKYGEQIPVLVDYTVQLLETQSGKTMSEFSLDDYKRGVLHGF